MRLFKMILMILVTLEIISCGSNDKPCNKSLPDNVLIPDSLISYFPEKNTPGIKYEYGGGNVFEKINETRYQPFEMNISYLVKTYSIASRSIYNELDSLFREECIVKINPIEDTNFFIVNNPSILLSRYDTAYLKDKYNSLTEGYLILDFVDYYEDVEYYESDTSTVLGFNQDFELYILEFGNQYVIDHSKYVEWEVLPQELKHGYSCGVVMNRKDYNVTYWAVAW